MAYDLLITNGSVVTAAETRAADVGIVGERIVAMAANLEREGAARVLDATGKYVIPGGVDVHTHLDMPLGETRSSDDFATGTRAAAFGGTTTILDFATPSAGQSLHDAVEIWKTKAAGKAVIDYGFHCVITQVDERTLREMDELASAGVTSFKVFMAYPGRLMLEDVAISRVLERSARNGALICVHAENGPAIEELIRQALAAGCTAPRFHARTRPDHTEAEATNRAIALAAEAGAPLYVVHVSCAAALQRVCVARTQGVRVFAETCPQYLFLTNDLLDLPAGEGAKYVLTPPLRTHSDQRKLWEGLQTGVLQAISTDHCPFNFHGQKDRDLINFTRIPNGGPGIEHRLALAFTGGVVSGRFTVNRFVELVSTAPAKLFGLYPRKGEIAAGSDADLVIFDPHGEQTISARTHHMRVDYSMYEGMKVTGVAETVIGRGRIVVEAGKCGVQPGSGEFLRRQRFSA